MAFDLAGRALLFFACAKKSKQKKAHPGDALSLRESPLCCSRARGKSFDATSLSRRNSAGSCPPSPARAPLLGASQGNPVRQTANSTAEAKTSWLMLCPLPRAGEGGASAPGEGTLFGRAHIPIGAPSLPCFAGTLSRTRERGKINGNITASGDAKQARRCRRSTPGSAAWSGARSGSAGQDGRLSFVATGMSRRSDPEHGAPSGDPFVGVAVERARTRGVLFLVTSFARAKEVTPGREGQKPSGHSEPRALATRTIKTKNTAEPSAKPPPARKSATPHPHEPHTSPHPPRSPASHR